MNMNILIRKPSIILSDFKPGEKKKFSELLRNPEISREYTFQALRKLINLKLLVKPKRGYYMLSPKGENMSVLFQKIIEGIK